MIREFAGKYFVAPVSYTHLHKRLQETDIQNNVKCDKLNYQYQITCGKKCSLQEW